MPGTILGTRDIEVNKQTNNLPLLNFCSYGRDK